MYGNEQCIAMLCDDCTAENTVSFLELLNIFHEIYFIFHKI